MNDRNKSKKALLKKGNVSPAACSILEAAGGNTEHAALVVKGFPQQIKLASNFTD